VAVLLVFIINNSYRYCYCWNT